MMTARRKEQDMGKNKVRIVFLALLGAALLAAPATRDASAQRSRREAKIWLRWSPDERQGYVWGFSVGHAEGYEKACRLMDGLWPVGVKRGQSDPLRICFAKEVGLSRGANYYAESVTEFYKRYPGDQDIMPGEILEQLAKGLTLDQIYRHSFPRHPAPAPRQ